MGAIRVSLPELPVVKVAPWGIMKALARVLLPLNPIDLTAKFSASLPIKVLAGRLMPGVLPDPRVVKPVFLALSANIFATESIEISKSPSWMVSDGVKGEPSSMLPAPLRIVTGPAFNPFKLDGPPNDGIVRDPVISMLSTAREP